MKLSFLNYSTKEIFVSYQDGSREVPRNMNTRWFGKWLSSYYEFKGWKREDFKVGAVRKYRLLGIEEKENDVPF